MPQLHAGIPFPILSRYEIEVNVASIIGQGGMGTVFKARDRLLNRNVAIKTIHPNMLDYDALHQDKHKRLFLREAMTHARLGNLYPQNIVEVRNYGIEDETPFMEMDILSGGSLRDRINQARQTRRRGPLFDEETIKAILSQICEGLKILHSHNVFHSDIKPENILFVQSSEYELRYPRNNRGRVASSAVVGYTLPHSA